MLMSPTILLLTSAESTLSKLLLTRIEKIESSEQQLDEKMFWRAQTNFAVQLGGQCRWQSYAHRASRPQAKLLFCRLLLWGTSLWAGAGSQRTHTRVLEYICWDYFASTQHPSEAHKNKVSTTIDCQERQKETQRRFQSLFARRRRQRPKTSTGSASPKLVNEGVSDDSIVLFGPWS